MSNSPQVDKLYNFFDKNGKILGCGIWKDRYIDEIPSTCGCNGIDPDDVEFWKEIFEIDENMISRMINE